MSSPNSPALQRLHRLDRSSPDFCDQLRGVLYEQEYVLHEKSFEQNDLEWLIDYLDEVLHRLDPSTPAARKCLRELRSICGSRLMLPTSYVLPSHLLELEPVPFTSGGSGDVYKGTLNGSKICVKRVRMYSQDVKKTTAKEFCKEAVTWKHLAHPNVLPLLGITIDHYQLISNWVSGGNLPEYVQKHPNADKLRLLCDVAEGLRYLHSRSVIHGDLKGANILVEDSGHILIADFGLAKVTRNLDSVRSASTQNGWTMRWVAPEVWIDGDYSDKADIFSFAMVMIEVFTGAIPFGDRSPWNAMIITTQGGRPQRPTHSTFTDSLWKLMQRCWNHDPQLRPDFSEVSRILLTPALPTWKQLITFPLSKDERIPLITSIFSDRDEVKVALDLSGKDAQAFIDAIDEALGSLTPEIRTRALHYLSGICGRQGLLPKSLPNRLSYDLAETAQRHSKLVTVWKGNYNGEQVAAKVLKDGGSDPERTRKGFYGGVVIWKNLHHPNVLPLLGTATTDDQFTAASKWMTNGNINEFVKVHPDANLLELLADVAKGLTYMHDLGVVHGNIAGSNILIDDNGRACLAGLSLLTVIPDELTTSSNSNGDATQRIGGIQWSAPEVLKGGAPGKETDIFSFAMMMIEIFSGTTPLGDVQDAMATLSVTQGDRPPRPKHPYVTGVLWKLIQRCWDKRSASRPEASEVLQTLLNSDPPPWKRLINPGLSTNERLDLIKSIFSDRDELEVFEYLSINDAQAFVDVIDEVLIDLDSLPQEIRRRCLHSSYEICGRKALLPKSPPIPLSYNKDSAPPHYGGFADIWKGEYNGQAVAAKVLRVYATSDLEKMRKRFCKGVVIWKTLRHPNVLPLLGFVGDQLTTVSEWMTNGDINEFMETHPDANRLELLADVTKGLIYMHDQGMVHGNLKGSNILIDNKGHACIAGFSLIRLFPDRSATPLSYISGGTTRWMSPELLNPEESGQSEGRPTPESDCYALGMVIYEVLTGDAPFARYSGFVVIRKVLDGGRPDRPQGPQGEWFPGGVWEILGRCWEHRPGDRPSLDVVLLCLQDAAPQWTPPPNAETDEEDEEWGNIGTGGGVLADAGG